MENDKTENVTKSNWLNNAYKLFINNNKIKFILEKLKIHPSFRIVFLWLGAIFCFVFFPIFLLDVGLESYIKTKDTIEEKEAYRKLQIDLEKLLQYGDGRHYYHSLLKKIFDIAVIQKNPISYLEKAIPHLKKRNPNVFNFIIWDNETSNIVNHLTDEKGHKYVLNKLKEVYDDISKENDNNYPVKIKEINSLSKYFNIIRPYIGNFIAEEGFLFPLLRANLGKIVPASENIKKSHFWFQANSKITMMVTINKEALDSLNYVDKLVNGLNNNSDDGIKYGMMDFLHNRSIIPESDEVKAAELNLSIAKYENYSNSKLNTENFLVLIKILNPFIRTFCYIPKNMVFKNNNLRKNTLLIAVSIIFLFFFGLFLLYKFTNYNFSMSWKLSLFFLYANGLPLLALGFIGYDYLEQNRNIQLEEVYDNISQFLNDFDLKFGLIKNEYSTKFNSIVDDINSNLSNKEKVNELYEKLKNETYKTGPSEFYIVATGSKVLYGSNNIGSNLVKDMSFNFLKLINNKDYTPRSFYGKNKLDDEKADKSAASFYNHSLVLDTVISKKGIIFSEQIIDYANYYYLNFMGDIENRNFESVVVTSWEPYKLQENYVKKHIKSLNNNVRGLKCIVFSDKYGNIFPEDIKPERELLSRFSQIINLTSLSFEKVVYKGENYAAFGMIGRELNKIALLGLFPLKIINERINKNKRQLAVFITISLALTLGISWLLSTYFLAPLKDLRKGIEAMGRQEFSYRLPIKSEDEFGSLSLVFNDAFESLEDLSVATTVQENLFPLESIKQNRTLVWGKSVTMTRLGGDYFDYFPLSDNEVGVLMGDVAGHGVPAGFLMAMAKASVLLTEEDKNNPSKLLAAIHKVFYHVKSRKIKRMMTCIYFCINTETGDFTMSNAGHCYPAFIDENANVKFLEIDGTPIGITKRARFVNTEGKLDNNSYLLLYTDGMLEAHNEAGESIGIKRFTELVSKSYSDDMDTFYNNLFYGIKEWAPLADDDITMVLVKYGFDGKNNVVNIQESPIISAEENKEVIN